MKRDFGQFPNYTMRHFHFQDIDECVEFGACSQGCVNTNGSYQCTCAPGFEILEDGRSCKAVGKAEPILLYASVQSVNWLKLKSKRSIRVKANGLNEAMSITYDGKDIYWTDVAYKEERIIKANPDGSNVQVRCNNLYFGIDV